MAPPRPTPRGEVPDAVETAEEEVDSIEEEKEEEDEEEEEDDDEEEEESSPTPVAGGRRESQRDRMNRLVRRMSSGPVPVRVHGMVIKGNNRTKASVIEAIVGDTFRSVTSMQELVRAAGIANARLRDLEIFDSVSITLDAGPPELANTANVVVEVVEGSRFAGDVGVYSRPGEAKSSSLELSLKLKNLLGYGDIWDASGAYGWNQTTEISTGISLPRFKAISTPLVARVSLLTQDWLKFSSYKEQLLGLSVGLISTKYHDLAYNLTWRTLSDPSRTSSKSIKKHLGHSLLSSLKYTFKVDRRDSNLRPTRGYAFVSTSHIGGLGDSKFLRFIRQEFDARAALPLGFYNTALNFGVAAGFVIPWGRGFMSTSSPVSDRFHIGGQSSLVCGLGGPVSLLGFKTRGLGPTDARRYIPSRSDGEDSDACSGRDILGGDVAVTTFADLSFDLPLKLFRSTGIHGHAFACAGNLVTLTDDKYKDFSFRNFLASFRSSVGLGIVVPTKLFRMEVNYCYILKQLEHDRGKTGVQFNFSSA